MTRLDPPVRPNCATCGLPRHPERSRKYAKGQAELDPFCSVTCARAYHHNPIPAESIWMQYHGQASVSRIPKDATSKRQEYRLRNRVPCEDCGTLVEGKGRSHVGGQDRPYLCVQCSHKRRKVAV